LPHRNRQCTFTKMTLDNSSNPMYVPIGARVGCYLCVCVRARARSVCVRARARRRHIYAVAPPHVTYVSIIARTPEAFCNRGCAWPDSGMEVGLIHLLRPHARLASLHQVVRLLRHQLPRQGCANMQRAISTGLAHNTTYPHACYHAACKFCLSHLGL
jgi:hypothetical protein